MRKDGIKHAAKIAGVDVSSIREWWRNHSLVCAAGAARALLVALNCQNEVAARGEWHTR